MRLQLPVALQWEMDYGLGVPCDSFSLTIPWAGDMPSSLDTWSKFQAEHEGEVVFTGVIDEVEAHLGQHGRSLELTGRGMAARLLDNSVFGQEYQIATIEDILADFVTAFGVEVGACGTVPSQSPFLVETGSSAWTVLENFVSYYTDLQPRFSRDGKLTLTALGEDSRWKIGENTAVTDLGYTWKRYGACSQVWVRDRVTQEVNKVVDEAQLALGLSRTAVVTTSGQSTQQKREYDGQYRLGQSQEEMLRVVVTLPYLQFLELGALVEIARGDWCFSGTYRLLELEIGEKASGAYTTLVLGKE